MTAGYFDSVIAVGGGEGACVGGEGDGDCGYGGVGIDGVCGTLLLLLMVVVVVAMIVEWWCCMLLLLMLRMWLSA